MPTVTIPDPTFDKLTANAKAKRLSLVEYLEDLAAKDTPALTKSARQLAAIDSFVKGTTAWTSKHLPPNHVLDDNRESIYEGRGE